MLFDIVTYFKKMEAIQRVHFLPKVVLLLSQGGTKCLREGSFSRTKGSMSVLMNWSENRFENDQSNWKKTRR